MVVTATVDWVASAAPAIQVVETVGAIVVPSATAVTSSVLPTTLLVMITLQTPLLSVVQLEDANVALPEVVKFTSIFAIGLLVLSFIVTVTVTFVSTP